MSDNTEFQVDGYDLGCVKQFLDGLAKLAVTTGLSIEGRFGVASDGNWNYSLPAEYVPNVEAYVLVLEAV
jgi:hypothetical protein